MVCKEDVVLWFRELSGHKRIDVMCSLLNRCLPTELRFFGTCLEDLGKQHFNHMKDFEVKANNPAELSELLVQCIISDTRTRQKLALYICLIHSLNTTCSNNLYKTLSTLDVSQIVPLSKNTDEKVLEELLLIYTIAVNHPAFTYEQKATLGNILLTLREKEDQLQATKLPEGLSEDYINSALNLSAPDATEMPPSNNPPCAEIPPRNIPPGMNYPPGLGSAENYIPIATYPPFAIQQHSPIVWQVFNIPSLPTEQMAVPEMAPPAPGAMNFPSSPHISRQSSPSQSASPSRTTSPVTKNYHHRMEQNNSQSRNKSNHPEYSYHNTAISNINVAKKSCLERFKGKDGGVKSEDEMRGLTERKTELGSEELQQLRTAVVNMNEITDPEYIPPCPCENAEVTYLNRRSRMHGLTERKAELGSEELQQLRTAVVNMNGITDPEHIPPCPCENAEVTYLNRRSRVPHQSVPILPRPLEGSVMANQPPSIVPLQPCCPVAGSGPRYTQHQVYCPHNLQALNLDNDGSRHCSSSSSSDASSTSHSPPATPGSNTQNWERGYSVQSTVEKPHRVPENTDTAPEETSGNTPAPAPPKPERTRIFAGRGRGVLTNPTGIQTLPRGRGPHSNFIVNNSHKNISNNRKEGPRSAPPTPHDDKKGYMVPSAEAPQSSSTMALPLSSSGKPPSSHDMVTSGVPYSTFLPPQFTGPPMFHTYHGAFVRPSYPFHNGDMQLYPYQPQPPFVPPPVVTYSTTIPPAKVACYNCSSQSHHASECKEPTMEEYTSKGQYRIDYKPYAKQGECLTEK